MIILAKLKREVKSFEKFGQKRNVWVDLDVTKKKRSFSAIVYFVK